MDTMTFEELGEYIERRLEESPPGELEFPEPIYVQ